MNARTGGATAAWLMVLVAPLLLGGGRPSPPSLPFAPGEVLLYRMRVSHLGTVGTGSLSVTGRETVRGHEVYVLQFDMNAKVGPVSASQHSRSWLDPADTATRRFVRREKRPLSREIHEAIEVYPEQRRWANAEGETGQYASSAPLDELAFLYFVRTLDLTPATDLTLARHYDVRRNPATVRLVGRTELRVPAGTYPTIIVDLRVRDPERYAGQGRIRLHLTDDDRRAPVRIETSMPDFGTIVLELESMQIGPEIR